MIEFILLLTFPVAMAFAAANDLFTMKIPNKISLVLIACFLAAALVIRMPLELFGTHIGIAAAVLTATFVLFSYNLLGGGDAKLMAAGALWMGPEHALPYLAYLTIFGGVLAVGILFYRKFIPANALPLPPWAMRLHVTGTGIPYGIAIAAAGLMLYPSTDWFRAFSGS